VKIDPHLSLLGFLTVVFRMSPRARANQSSWISDHQDSVVGFQPEVPDRALAE
jgi:hypothetical protein